ncbi:F-box domain-containing protein [Colletotrichum truncatum]|uniref:F-box domain-containing protein n=1 Tax=Colletotrichum truncatum TaxID=5467 RepID=A0ACC3ZBJ3_COLTU|nr:F-box domain-containing protein [Colletotrichum truncatum]KAF6787819.1 F-box domain-containing protein [Colletotrichum truncatum]
MSDERTANASDASMSPRLLAEQFSLLLKPSDGAPDVLLRQENLKNLVDSLSPWELTYLRNVVRDKHPVLASLSNLPREVIVMIARQISARDAIACSHVSKDWRSSMTDDFVINELLEIHFPGSSHLLLGSSSEMPSQQLSWPLFVDITSNLMRLTEGNFISSLAVNTGLLAIHERSCFTLDDSYIKYREGTRGRGMRPLSAMRRPSTVAPRNYAYSNGRVAWQAEVYGVFVDDLRAMTRTHISPPDLVLKGEVDFAICTMTEKLVVLVDSVTERNLIVYHLELQEYRNVTLPNRAKFIFAHKETIAVQFSTSPFTNVPHVWRWGRGLAKLKLPSIPKASDGVTFAFERSEKGGLLNPAYGFIFHPTQTNLLYSVSILGGPKIFESNMESTGYNNQTEPLEKCFVITVHKFDDLKHTQSFRLEVPNPLRDIDCDFRCRPMNPYGLYNLFTYYTDSPATKDYLVWLINFNVVKERFSQTYHDLSKGMRRPLWNMEANKPEECGGIPWHNQLYYLQGRVINSTPEDSELWWSLRLRSDNVICATDDSRVLVMGGYDKDVIRTCRSIDSIEMDKDFIVALSQDGYVVWNFSDPNLKGKPWRSNDGTSSMWRRFTAQDTQCPIRNCEGPAAPASWCFLCRPPAVPRVEVSANSEPAVSHDGDEWETSESEGEDSD